MKKIAIIGAGPAGIAATRFLKDADIHITLFEANKAIGEKLKLTGGGRMNVTNKNLDESHYNSTSKGNLKKLFKNPWIQNREKLLDELGIKYVWEGNRALLKSEDAVAEVQKFQNQITHQKNTTLRLKTFVSDIKKTETGFALTTLCDGAYQTEEFQTVICTTGGMYRIGRKSIEDEIYALPKSLGHTIERVSPSLSPLRITPSPFKELSGIALPLTLTNSQTKKSLTGDALLTHVGLSGPVALDFSAHLTGDSINIRLYSETTEEHFLQEFNALRTSKTTVRSHLKKHIPQRVTDWIMKELKLPLNLNIADTSKSQLAEIRKRLFQYTVSPVSRMPYAGCWTTKGGVSLSEINTSTLESKKIPELFFAGEVLDVDGLCGGYNITFAFVSAKIVSAAIKKRGSRP